MMPDLLRSFYKASPSERFAILDSNTDNEAVTVKGMCQLLLAQLVCPRTISAEHGHTCGVVHTCSCTCDGKTANEAWNEALE